MLALSFLDFPCYVVCGKSQRGKQLNLSLKEEVLEDVDAFNHLGAIVGKNERIEGGVFE